MGEFDWDYQEYSDPNSPRYHDPDLLAQIQARKQNNALSLSAEDQGTIRPEHPYGDDPGNRFFDWAAGLIKPAEKAIEQAPEFATLPISIPKQGLDLLTAHLTDKDKVLPTGEVTYPSIGEQAVKRSGLEESMLPKPVKKFVGRASEKGIDLATDPSMAMMGGLGKGANAVLGGYFGAGAAKSFGEEVGTGISKFEGGDYADAAGHFGSALIDGALLGLITEHQSREGAKLARSKGVSDANIKLARPKTDTVNVLDIEGQNPPLNFNVDPIESLPVESAGIRGITSEPSIENNASGESGASMEAMSRQNSMKAKGEKYVVYDRAGNRREIIGPDAVDFRPSKGETYGIEDSNGFRTLDDQGGKVNEKTGSQVDEIPADVNLPVDESPNEYEITDTGESLNDLYLSDMLPESSPSSQRGAVGDIGPLNKFEDSQAKKYGPEWRSKQSSAEAQFHDILRTGGEDKLSKLADAQRGVPESKMLEAGHALGGGVMQHAIEHAGDLTHRMSELNTRHNAGFTYVKEKVDSLLNSLTNPYGFMKEHSEQLVSNIKYNKASFTDTRAKVDKLLKEYADAHKDLPTFNDAQKVAQSIPIAIAEGRINDAVSALKILKGKLDEGPELWKSYAHEGIDNKSNVKFEQAPPASATNEPVGLVNHADLLPTDENIVVPPDNVDRVVKRPDGSTMRYQSLDNETIRVTHTGKDGNVLSVKEGLDFDQLQDVESVSESEASPLPPEVTTAKIIPPETPGSSKGQPPKEGRERLTKHRVRLSNGEIVKISAKSPEDAVQRINDYIDKEYPDTDVSATEAERIMNPIERAIEGEPGFEGKMKETKQLSEKIQREQLNEDEKGISQREREFRQKTNLQIKLEKAQNREEISKRLKELKDAETEHKSEGGLVKVLDEITNTAKTARSAMDISFPVRQGIFSASHPEALKAMAKGLKSGMAEEHHLNVQKELADSPNAELYEKYLNQVKYDPTESTFKKGDKEGHKSEEFGGSYLDKLPGIKQTERIFIDQGNLVRAKMFDAGIEKLKKAGYTPEKNPEAYKTYGEFLNVITGRATLPVKLNQASYILNKLLWSPRFMYSRIRLIDAPFRVPKELRMRAIADVYGTLALTGTALASAAAVAKSMGEDVEYSVDPADTNFGKLRVGKTVYDFSASVAPMVRTLYRMSSGRIKTKSGESALAGKTLFLHDRQKDGDLPKAKFGRSVWDEGTEYIGNKASPLVSVTKGLATGKGFGGEEYGYPEAARDLLAPMSLEQIIQNFYDYGLGESAKALPGIFGVGVQTEIPESRKAKPKNLYKSPSKSRSKVPGYAF